MAGKKSVKKSQKKEKGGGKSGEDKQGKESNDEKAEIFIPSFDTQSGDIHIGMGEIKRGVVQSTWSGPLPPQVFENLTPELAEKLVNGHQKAIENRLKEIEIEIEDKLSERRWRFGFGISILLTLLAIIWIALGYNNPDVIHRVVVPMITLAAGAIGGYGYGSLKGSRPSS